jgi:zeaxanthin glucosyltransferase
MRSYAVLSIGSRSLHGRDIRIVGPLTWHAFASNLLEVDVRIDVVVRPESGHVVPALHVMHALQRLGHEVRFVCLGLEAWKLTADAGVVRVKHFAPTVPASEDVPAQWRAGTLGKELARRAWSIAQDWGALFAGAGAVMIDQTLPEVVLPALSRRLPVIILSTHLSYARRGATPPLTVFDTNARRAWATVRAGVARTDRQLLELVESRHLPPVMHPEFWHRWAAELKLDDHLGDSCLSMLPGWRGLAELILVPEQLELPGHHRAAGLYYLPPPMDLVKVSRPVMARRRGRLALCAFGSQLQNYGSAELRDRAQLLIDAVALLPDFFLALQAPDRLRRALRLNDRVEARSSWPQRALLQEAALFFTHCGVNSMLEAVRCGVPMVAQPLRWDQPGNAMRLEHHGLARCVREWTPSGIAAVAREALALPKRRLRAAASYFPIQADYDGRLGSVLPSLVEHACSTHRSRRGLGSRNRAR